MRCDNTVRCRLQYYTSHNGQDLHGRSSASASAASAGLIESDLQEVWARTLALCPALSACSWLPDGWKPTLATPLPPVPAAGSSWPQLFAQLNEWFALSLPLLFFLARLPYSHACHRKQNILASLVSTAFPLMLGCAHLALTNEYGCATSFCVLCCRCDGLVSSWGACAVLLGMGVRLVSASMWKTRPSGSLSRSSLNSIVLRLRLPSCLASLCLLS